MAHKNIVQNSHFLIALTYEMPILVTALNIIYKRYFVYTESILNVIKISNVSNNFLEIKCQHTGELVFHSHSA